LGMDADTIGILARGLLDAIRANELERAEKLIAAAERQHTQVDFQGRASVVDEINLAIQAAKRAKKSALAAAKALRGVPLVDLEQRVLGPLERLMEREIDKLLAEKRRRSRGGRP